MAPVLNGHTHSYAEILKLDKRFLEAARGQADKRRFVVPEKLTEIPQNIQASAELPNLPIELLILILEELDQYDQLALLLTCKWLLCTSYSYNLKYDPYKRHQLVDPSEIPPAPPHDTALFAAFLVRIRVVRADGTFDRSWRPCIDCLRYRRVHEDAWSTTEFPGRSGNDFPVLRGCKENAINEWCRRDSLSCASCLVKNFPLSDEVVTYQETGVVFVNYVRACLNCPSCREPVCDEMITRIVRDHELSQDLPAPSRSFAPLPSFVTFL